MVGRVSTTPRYPLPQPAAAVELSAQPVPVLLLFLSAAVSKILKINRRPTESVETVHLSGLNSFSTQCACVFSRQANTVVSGFAVLIGDKWRQRQVGLQEDTRVDVIDY